MDLLGDVVMAMRMGSPHWNLHHFDGPWSMSFPAHEGGGFHVVLKGSCWFRNGSRRPAIPMVAGDVVFVRGPGDHVLGGFESGDAPPLSTTLLCGAYTLDKTTSHPFFQDLPEIIHIPADAGSRNETRAAVDLLAGEIRHSRPGGSVILPALLDSLLIYILRDWMSIRDEGFDLTGWTAALRDPVVAVALNAIHDEPLRPWSVESLASTAGVSRAAFARRFTTIVGQPPLSYVRWWRMTLSARLLRESDLPLRSVARQAGYASEVGYATAFKNEFGQSPGRYRRRHRPGVTPQRESEGQA